MVGLVDVLAEHRELGKLLAEVLLEALEEVRSGRRGAVDRLLEEALE